MAIDFSKPVATDAYATLLTGLQSTISSLGMLLDPAYAGTLTNVPTGAKRLNAGLFEQFNGTSWVAQTINGLAQSGSNYGFGLTGPTHNLHVRGTGQSTAAVTDAGAKGGMLYLQDVGNSAGNGGALMLGTVLGNGTPFAAIKGLVVDGTTNTKGSIAFCTRANVTDTALTRWMTLDFAGYLAMNTTTPAERLHVGGSVAADNYRIADSGSSAAGTFGFSNGNGPGMIAWGSATAGAGSMEFLGGSVTQMRILPNSSAVNRIDVTGGATGVRPSLSASGSDTNIGLSFSAKGNGDFAWFGGSGTQFRVLSASNANRFLQVAGSFNANPFIAASAGLIEARSGVKCIGAASTAGDVATTGVLVAADKIAFVDSTQAADGRQSELNFNSGGLLGRFVNDAYSSAANWIQVVGTSAAISRVSLYGGASVEMLRVEAGGVRVGGSSSPARKLDVAGGAMTTAVAVGYAASLTLDAAASNLLVVGNLTGNVTSMAISNGVEGQFLSIRFRQDATGGRTVALPSGAAVSGSISTTANKTSYLNLTYNATDARWEGAWSQIP